MAIVTVDDVIALSGEGDFDEDTYSLAETLIDLIQGDMEAYLDHAVEVRQFTETHLLPIERSYIYLRNTPVQSVQQVVVNSFVLQPTWYFPQAMGVTLYGNAWGFGYGFAPVGANVAAWLSPVATFQVTYVGGLDLNSDPRYKILRHILIRAVLEQITVAREGDTGRAGYISMKVEDYSWRKSEAVVAGVVGRSGVAISAGPFTEADMQIMNRFKRKTAVS